MRQIQASLGTTAALVLALTLTPASARAQQPARDTAHGIALYRKGDAAGAVKALREALKKEKDDAEGWYYLGLAQVGAGRPRDARSAFKRAIELRPDHAGARNGLAHALLLMGKPADAEKEARRVLGTDARNVEAHYLLGASLLQLDREREAVREADAVLAIDQRATAALLLKGMALANLYVEEYDALSAKYLPVKTSVGKVDEAEAARRRVAYDALLPMLNEAAEAFEKAVALEPNSPRAAQWREQAETLRAYSQSAGPNAPYRASEVTTKAIIRFRPEPTYPESAREDGVEGMVRLRAVLAADGQVRHIFVLRSPDARLTRAAIDAARKIRFDPATKDGQKVSQMVVIEYNFNIY